MCVFAGQEFVKEKKKRTSGADFTAINQPFSRCVLKHGSQTLKSVLAV